MEKLPVLALLLMVVVVACADTEPKSNDTPSAAGEKDVVRFKEPDALYDLLNLKKARYTQLSAEELAARSTFIGTGVVVDIREGMTKRWLTSKSGSATYFLVIDFSINTTVKGNADKGHVYVWYSHGGAFSAATYRANMPKDPATVFLAPPPWDWDNPEYEYEGREKGYPAGAQAYVLTNPQGWLIEKDGKVVQPLEGGENLQLFGGLTSLVEVERQVAADSSGPDAAVQATLPIPPTSDAGR